MKWQDLRRSDNVEDRRGMSPAGGFGGGFGGGGGMIRTGGLGIGGLLILLVVSYLFGIDPLSLLSPDQSSPGYSSSAPAGPPGSDEAAVFAEKILGDTEDVWGKIFAQAGQRYPPPTLVLFSDSAESACGFSSAAVGPFYCPGDRKVYLDLSFFHELDRRFSAPGDFAKVYVIAHEVGHHVQNLVGALQNGGGNAQSVRQELQADCLAGVWGHSASTRVLESGDLEDALNAASAIGDDTLQRRSSGHVVPESFTHGSSADRVAAFRRGFDGGDLRSCGIGR